MVLDKPKIRIKKEKLGYGLRLYTYNKKFLDYLIKDLGLKQSPKTFTNKIPKKLLPWEYSKYILRGLFETDGSLYFSRNKNKNHHTYPRIKIKTSSINLVKQLITILKNQGFRPTIRKSKSDRTFGVLLSGNNMLDKWHEKVGFNTIKNLSKYVFFKQNGYYIPKMSISERLFVLKRGSPSG